MKKLLFPSYIIIILLLMIGQSSEAQNFTYTNPYHPSWSYTDIAMSVSNEAYTAGFSSTGNMLAKFTATGGLGRSIPLPSAVNSTDFIELDDTDHVYVSGRINGTADMDPGTGVTNITGSNDRFIAKYTTEYELVWVKTMPGLEIIDMGIGEDGHVNLLGRFEGTIDVNPNAGVNNLTSYGMNDLGFVKISNEGNYLSSFKLGSTGNESRTARFDLDSQGNVYVGLLIFPNSSITIATGQTLTNSKIHSNVILVKYSSTGTVSWYKQLSYTTNSSLTLEFRDIAVSATGVYFGGESSSNGTLSLGSGINSSVSGGIVGKYSLAGTALWLNRLPELDVPNFSASILVMDVDKNDDLWILNRFDYLLKMSSSGSGTLIGTISALDRTPTKISVENRIGVTFSGVGEFPKMIRTCIEAPAITSLTASKTTVGINVPVTLTVNGELNSATDWVWYSGSCGGTLEQVFGEEFTTSIAATTTFYVRGEDSECQVTCASITIQVDSTYPTITSLSPADNGTMPKSSNLTATFSENIALGTPKNISVYHSNGSLARTFNTGNSNVLVNNNVLTLQSSSSFVPGAYYVGIPANTITDVAGNSFAGISNNTIWNFTAVNSAPTNIQLSSNTLLENNESAAVIGSFSTTDPDAFENHVYSLVSGSGSDDNSRFNIIGNQLRAVAIFDFETKSSYSIRVRTNDGEANFEKVFTISVLNQDDPQVVSVSPTDDATNVPLDQVLSITFNKPIRLGTITTGPPTIKLYKGAGSFVESFIPSSNPSTLSVSGNVLTIDPTNDLQANTTYHVLFDRKTIEDTNGNYFYDAAWGTTTWNFSTGSGTSNSAPTNITLSAATINENNAINAVIGNLSTTDADAGDTHAYSLVSGTGSTDNASFNISGNQLRASAEFDFESKNSYSIRVRTNDGQETFEKVFTITINDLAEDTTPPTVVSRTPADNATNVSINVGTISFTLSENVVAGTGKFELFISPANTAVYEFVMGSSDLTINDNVVTLNNVPQLLNSTTYWIRNLNGGANAIKDLSGNALAAWTGSTDWNFTTAVAANSAPTNIGLSPSSINENNAINAVIGNLSTTDEDAGNTHTYSLVSGTGSTDNASFNISGNQLRASSVFDFESKNSYSIRVRTNDGQATFEKVFTITILDLTDTDVTPPTVLSLSPADDATNVPVNATFVATFSEDIMLQPGIGLVAIAKDGIIQITYNASSPELSVSGSVLTINPSSDLLPNANYIMYVGGGVKDLDGNSIGEVLNLATSWNFTTGATSSAPSIKYQFPENGATEMEIDLYGNDLAFDFEEDVSTGSAAVVLIKNYANDELIESIDIANQTYTGGFVEVPVTSLPYDTKVYIVIEPIGSITSDETGLTFAGLDDKDDWTFTTIAAPVPPLISSLSPADNATNVPVNSILSLDFDVDVYVSSDVSLEIRNYQTDALIESLPISEAAYVDQPIVITPMNDLPMETQLYVILSGSGYIEGYSCNCTEFDGLTNKDDWSFTTQGASDVTSPTITSLTPSNGSNFGFLNSGVNFTFSETVVEGSGTVVLYDENDQVLETVTTGLSDTRISLAANPRVVVDFDYEVAEGTLYKVSIDQGAFEDAAGNPADGILASDWSFTTISRPQVTTLSPLDGSTDVAVDTDLIIHFDQIVNGQDDPSSNIYIKNFETDAIIATVNTSAMTFDHDFDEETTIVTVNLIDDLPENIHAYVQSDPGDVFTSDSNGSTVIALNDKGAWDFTTESLDIVSPQVISFSPLDDAIDVAIDADLIITFDEPLSTMPNDGFVRVRDKSNGVPVLGGRPKFNSELFTINGNQLTIHLAKANEVAYGVEYYVTIQSGTLIDLSGNPYEGFDDSETWTFTTIQDPIPPQLVSLSPQDDAIDVDVKATLIATFDEPIFLVPGESQSVVIYKENLSSPYLILASDDSRLSISGKSLTLDLGTLEHNTQYWIWLRDLTDFYGNYIENFSVESWNFTTEGASQTISFEPLPQKSYGNASFDLTATASSDLPVAFSSSDETVATISGYTVTIVGAGNTIITASQPGDDSFKPALDVEQELVVTMAIVSATADNQTRVYNTDNPTFTISYGGFVNSESEAVLDVLPTASTTADIASDAGTYPITPSEGMDTDYDFRYTNGTLTITKADQTIIFPAIADIDIANTTTVTLLATSDAGLDITYTLDQGDGTISGTVLTVNSTGNYTVTASQAGNTNYNAAIDVSQSFTVTDSRKTDQTITFNAISEQEYGDDLTLGATASSSLPVSYTLISGSGTITNGVLTIESIGTYEVRASQNGDNTFNPAPDMTQTFTVTKAMLTATADDQTISEGDVIPTLTFTYSGFKLSDDEASIDTAPDISTTATSQSAAGNYPITLTGGSDDLYEFSLVNSTLTIEEVLGIGEQEISIYPNPTRDVLYVQGMTSGTVRILSLEGKLLKSGRVLEQLDVSDLIEGTYLLQLESDSGETLMYRFVKK